MGTAIGVDRGMAVVVAVEDDKEFIWLVALLISKSCTVRSLMQASNSSSVSLSSLPAALKEARGTV